MKRFFDKVNKTETCWNWTAGGRGSGYGAMKYGNKIVDAHRISWLIHYGDIPPNICICHTCDNRSCVNPKHLFLGTHKDNMQDCKNKGRLVIPTGGGFKINHVSLNRSIKNDEDVKIIKSKILNRKTSLKKLSEELSLPYQLLRDISCGRVYKNI